MDFQLTPEEEAFRAEVRAFLDENLPPAGERGPGFNQEWDAKVRARGWVGFSWPKEIGGGGGSIMEQVILKDEMAQRRAPARPPTPRQPRSDCATRTHPAVHD